LRIFSRPDGVLDADNDFSGKDRMPGLRRFFQLDAQLNRMGFFQAKERDLL
jgi:hypothetical protein